MGLYQISRLPMLDDEKQLVVDHFLAGLSTETDTPVARACLSATRTTHRGEKSVTQGLPRFLERQRIHPRKVRATALAEGVGTRVAFGTLMAKSPGHRSHPHHKVAEQHLQNRVVVQVHGEILADSGDVIRVSETGYPARYYFPRSDVKMGKLSRTNTSSQCPFKGVANYYAINVDGQRVDDAAWTYEVPFDEHASLATRMAFYDDKVPDLDIRLEEPTERNA